MKKYSKTTIAIILVIIFITLTNYSLTVSNKNTIFQETTRLQEIITKATIDCYAIQGIYPRTFIELKEEYNLHINEIDYVIYYDYNGANIMPDIHVIRKE